MADEEFNPGEVIYLSSGDEAAAMKKRPLEDLPKPEPKRLRSHARANNAPKIEESSEKDWKPTGDSTVAGGKFSTQPSTSDDSAPEDSGEIPDYKQGKTIFKVPNLADKKGGSWLKRFKDWAKAFHALNPGKGDAITSSLVYSAYGYYIDRHAGLKPKKRKNAKQVAKELESTGELEALLRSLQPPNDRGPSQSTLDSWVTRQTRSEPVRKGKRSRASSVSEGEIEEGVGDGSGSESEAEYEPTLSKSERTREDGKEEPPSGMHAHANDDSIPNPQSLPPIDTHRNVPSGNDALKQQRRYFPSANDPAQMCLLCGLNTHLAHSCPTLICSLCGSLEHSNICCPGKERCSKCRQPGHQASRCNEKLALIKEEGLACVFCNSADHLEEQCTLVWRSFHPDTSTVKKVAFIPASCAVCGSDRHFCSDCNAHRNTQSNPTWSVKNRDQYIDPDCGLAAIEEAIGGPPNIRTARAPDLKIRGHAARTTNVHYSESDDSEVEFLGHKRVQKPAIGQIRMASNIQLPSTQNGALRRNNRHNGAPVQPPLPPGPPPSGPPPMRGPFGNFPPPPGVPPGPYSSLPRKPPAQDYRNVPPPPPHSSQGQGRPHGSSAPQGSKPRGGGRGGRAGRGGRGRGRGRGK
ncbi:Protein AIR2 [Fusarium austroafricanum]|uniref:Protein AIR2 n=1 Tax=Fusarium austroafricanum TaxID=2364996 RepID=A0A8H4JUA4_9HYPO|nr:Protein AIR2 [Fusarium austroafricanum]